MPATPFSQSRIRSLLEQLAGERDFVLLETARCTAEEHRSYLFRQPLARLVCRAGDAPAPFFAAMDGWLDRGYYLAGFFAYEFGYLLEPALRPCLSLPQPLNSLAALADLGVYPPPRVSDHETGGAQEQPPEPWFLPSAGGEPDATDRVGNIRLSMDRERYVAAIERIKRHIESGDTYQVNFALRLLFDFTGSDSALYQALRRNQSVSYGAFLKSGERRILSFSPELFFRKTARTLTVRPMKGTARRGATTAEDRSIRGLLQADAKNRSENVMIVDLLRNDLGRICRPGQVRTLSLFEVDTYESLHQMTSTVTGELAGPESGPGVVEEILRALFPSGSVTGAPKIRTMQIIRELETGPRGVYTGAIGFIAPNRDMVFNVPIRTLVLDGDRGEMGIGSGVVSGSDPLAEWAECRLKGRFLIHPAPDFRLIESLLWLPESGFWLLDLHRRRLAESAAYFQFAHDPEKVAVALAAAEKELAESGPETPRRVRLTLDKEGTVAVSYAECAPPRATALPDPATITPADEAGCPAVTLSPLATDPASPFLHHKTTLRDLYDGERQRAAAAGFLEVLFANDRGELTEGSISNIVLLRDGVYRTPPLASGLLNGVCRQSLLADPRRPVVEEVLSATDLDTATALFVVNSVRGVVRVRRG